MSKKFNNSYNACNWMRSTIPDLSNKSFTSRASCALTRGVRAPSIHDCKKKKCVFTWPPLYFQSIRFLFTFSVVLYTFYIICAFLISQIASKIHSQKQILRTFLRIPCHSNPHNCRTIEQIPRRWPNSATRNKYILRMWCPLYMLPHAPPRTSFQLWAQAQDQWTR